MRYFTFFFHKNTSNSSLYFALTAHLKVSQPHVQDGGHLQRWMPPPGWALTRATPHQARYAAYYLETQARGSDGPWSPCICAFCCWSFYKSMYILHDLSVMEYGGEIHSLITRNKTVECFFLFSWGMRACTWTGGPLFPRTEEFVWRWSCWHRSTSLHDTHKTLDNFTLWIVWVLYSSKSLSECLYN